MFNQALLKSNNQGSAVSAFVALLLLLSGNVELNPGYVPGRMSKHFMFCHLNIAPIRPKFPPLQKFILDKSIDVSALNELLSEPRQFGNGGGVAIVWGRL